MTEPQFKVKTAREIEEQVQSALLARALWQRRRQEMEALEREAQEDGEAAAQAEAQRQETLARIRRETGRARRAHILRHGLPRVAAAVVLAALVGNAALTTAVAAIPAVRVRVLELLVNIEKEYTEIGLRESEGTAMDVPEGWLGNYFPAEVPEGYVVSDMNSLGGYNRITYVNEEGMKLSFIEGSEDSSNTIDTENANVGFMTIKGSMALVSEKENHVFVAWNEQDRYFIVDMDGTMERAIQIAQSVTRIR